MRQKLFIMTLYVYNIKKNYWNDILFTGYTNYLIAARKHYVVSNFYHSKHSLG